MRYLLTLAASLLAFNTAQAAIIYDGTLPDNAVVAGVLTSQSGWINSDGFEVNYYSFNASLGQSVNISAIAGTIDLDLAFTLYQGVTDALATPFEFLNDQSFGGVNFLTLVSTPGDEFLTNFVIPVTGVYTLIIGGETPDFLASGTPPFNFTVQASLVPEPASLALFGLGLVGLFGMSRRKRV